MAGRSRNASQAVPASGFAHELVGQRDQGRFTMARGDKDSPRQLRRAMCIAEDAPLEAAGEDDRAQAKKIAAQLDGLPLAP